MNPTVIFIIIFAEWGKSVNTSGCDEKSHAVSVDQDNNFGSVRNNQSNEPEEPVKNNPLFVDQEKGGANPLNSGGHLRVLIDERELKAELEEKCQEKCRDECISTMTHSDDSKDLTAYCLCTDFIHS